MTLATWRWRRLRRKASPSSSGPRSWSQPWWAPASRQPAVPDDVGLQLLENTLITGAALVALILALRPVSAAFNPVVTLVERFFGRSRDRRVGLIAAQVAAAASGPWSPT